MLIAGGGLNSSIELLRRGDPFDPFAEFKSEFRCIGADLRNANGGQSSGPLEIDRPWDAYTDDHIGLMDHLGIDKFMVMGFCIGGPFIWNLLERAPNRVVAAVLAQPSGSRPEAARPLLRQQHEGVGSGAHRPPARDHHGDGGPVPHAHVPHEPGLRLHRDARLRAELSDAGADSAQTTSRRIRMRSRWKRRCWRQRRR